MHKYELFHSPFDRIVILNKSVFVFLLVAGTLCGCASSMFDEPYEEIDEPVPVSVQSEEIELEPGDLHELIAHGAPAKRYDDIWQRIREGFAVLEMDKDPVVARVAKRFAEEKRLERTALRAAGFLYYVVDAVEARKLPMEVILVPFVESGYTLEALSSAEANGAWQFIESTARNYDIGIDRFRDDRRNLIASTRAALDYLSKLNEMFDSWPLAMAAYNCGEKRVMAEVNRAKARGIKKPGFNHLAPYLPQETRDYVPRIFALKKIIADPAAFKSKLPHIENAPVYSVVEIHRSIDTALVANLAGMPLADLQKLNPSVRAPVIIGGSNTQLLLPHQAALQLTLRMVEHTGAWVSWRMLRITRAASPADIARRTGVPLKTVLQANPLPEGHYYEVGSTIMLPGRPRAGDREVDAKSASQAVLRTRSAPTCLPSQLYCNAPDASGKPTPAATENGLPRK